MEGMEQGYLAESLDRSRSDSFHKRNGIVIIAVIICAALIFLAALFLYGRFTAKKVPKEIHTNFNGMIIDELAMVDADAGWFYNSDRSVFHTMQGLQAFEKVGEVKNIFVTSDRFMDTCFLNENSAYFSYFADASRIALLYTNDGGVRWNETYVPYTDNATAVYVSFSDEENGYLLYCSNMPNGTMAKKLFQSRDGGASFELAADLSNVISGEPTGISFVTKETGYIGVSGEDHYLYRTGDQGQSWESVALNTYDKADAPYYINGYVPVFYGSDRQSGRLVLEYGGERISYVVYKTADGGNTWTAEGTLLYDDTGWNRIMHYSFWSDTDGCIVDAYHAAEAEIIR